ncbi:uncharacterized protein [Misgurnus anguillicaudatus]|uniref:uncharacterized protein isoform X1 n=1 Tax=Misgurnus anguillicaudatus TaxID=75329 RepID=UPI003CCF7682
MRIERINSHLLSEQHWILIIFVSLLTVVLTDESVINAFLGDKATIRFNVTGSTKITQIELNRCTEQKIFVFSPEHGLNIQDQNYDGRVSVEKTHIILERLQESDFGTYCYKLTTFPLGSLEEKIKLVRETTNDTSGPPIIMIIGLTCGIGLAVLCGVIGGVVCHKKRHVVHIVLDPKSLPVLQKDRERPNGTPTQRDEEEDHNDGNYLNVM